MTLLQRIKMLVLGSDADRRRAKVKSDWNAVWSKEGAHKPWMGRGVAGEIVEAVESGWFARGGRSIDIGCGEGELTGYLAENGITGLGVDISEAAIARAKKAYGGKPRATFAVHDVCESVPNGGPFEIVVDRGCLHQIAEADRPAYRRNLLAMTAPNARMILFVRAFRDGVAFGDEAERNKLTRQYANAIGPSFTLVRSEPTHLDTNHGADAGTALGGLVFWFERASIPVR